VIRAYFANPPQIMDFFVGYQNTSIYTLDDPQLKNYDNSKVREKVDLRKIRKVFISYNVDIPDDIRENFEIVDKREDAEVCVVTDNQTVYGMCDLFFSEYVGYVFFPCDRIDKYYKKAYRKLDPTRQKHLDFAIKWMNTKHRNFNWRYIKTSFCISSFDAEEMHAVINCPSYVMHRNDFIKCFMRQKNRPITPEVFKFVCELFDSGDKSNMLLGLNMMSNYNIERYIGRLSIAYMRSNINAKIEIMEDCDEYGLVILSAVSGVDLWNLCNDYAYACMDALQKLTDALKDKEDKVFVRNVIENYRKQ
jgi:hypothetical protein